MTPSIPRLTVYEIINEKRQEIFVGMTDLPIFELVAKLSKRRPGAIAHWDLSEPTGVRSVEFNLKADAARQFVREYVRSGLPSGWRYLTEE